MEGILNIPRNETLLLSLALGEVEGEGMEEVGAEAERGERLLASRICK